jgi:hypothetical protein
MTHRGRAGERWANWIGKRERGKDNADDATRRLLAGMGNRLIKMVAELCQLNKPEK